MIIGIDLINSLVLDTNFSGHVIIGVSGPYKEFSVSMVYINNHDFKYLIDKLLNRMNPLLNFTLMNYYNQKSQLVKLY